MKLDKEGIAQEGVNQFKQARKYLTVDRKVKVILVPYRESEAIPFWGKGENRAGLI